MMKNLDLDKSSWKRVKFGDVVVEPKETCKDFAADGIVHVVGLEHIDTGDIHLRKSATTEESTTFTKKFRKGDVLFGRRRAYLKKAAQAEFDGICSGDITVFRAQRNLLPELLPFIVNNDRFFDYAIKHSAGGLSPRVKYKDLANYEFLLPPKEEQSKLAELLWAMDEVIERGTILKSNLEIFSVIEENQIFNAEINSKLKEVVLRTLSGGTPDTKMEEYYSNGEIPWITTKILDGDHIGVGEKLITKKAIFESAAKILDKGNILAGTRVGVGKFAINDVDISFSQDITGLEINNDLIDARYLVYQLNSFAFQERIKPFLRGTTIKGITKNDLLEMKICIPSLGEQKRIKTRIQSIKNSIYNVGLKIDVSKTLQKSLINQVFSSSVSTTADK